jgi:hypothetical protein
MKEKDDDSIIQILILKCSAYAAMFTEGNHDYNNDDTIILASAITLNELHEKKKIINVINKGISNDFCSEYDLSSSPNFFIKSIGKF